MSASKGWYRSMHHKVSLSNRIKHYMDAGFPLLYLETFDVLKAENLLHTIAKECEYSIVEHNARGVFFKESLHYAKTKLAATLDNFINPPPCNAELYDLNKKMLVLKDVADDLKNSEIVGKLRYLAELIISDCVDCRIIIVSPTKYLPSELEHLVTLLTMDYPTDSEIKETMEEFCTNNKIKLTDDLERKMLNAFKGMSEYEIRSVLQLAYAIEGRIDASHLELIHEQKKQIVKKSGILEMMEVEEKLYSQIGGLSVLKNCLKRKQKIFQNLAKAEAFGVDRPKGLLIAGLPGCGKSLTAKATANLLKVPLLRLDMGRLMGKYVGESEGNLRRAIALADAIAPCVLWMDELEKSFSGVGGQGVNAELTTRLMGTFLTWMQEKESLTFVIATVNNIGSIPAEFLRKGRFDDVFYVDLPNEREREEILRIHVNKRRPGDLNHINIPRFAKEMNGYSGADIEGIVKDAVEATFDQDVSELSDLAIEDAMQNTHPLSETMKEEIEAMRKDYERRSFKPASWQ